MVHAIDTWTRRLAPSVLLALIAAGCDGDGGAGPGAVPASVVIAPADLELRIGESRALEARYLDDDGRTVPAPTGWTPVWASSDTAIVVVGEDGTARGVREGTATVTLSAGPLAGEAAATVLAPVATPDSAATARATIDETGGSITAPAASGTRYTLAVPPGAVDAPVEITVTPLTGIEHFPLSGGPVAAVEFGPDGLEFLNPAELTIVAPAAVDPGTLVGFVITDDGFRLAPVQVRGDTLVLMVGHFSGAGVASGEPDEVAALAALGAKTAEEAAAQALAAYLNEMAAAERMPDPERIAEILAGWFEASVRPGLEAAASDSTRLTWVIAEFWRWHGMVGHWANGFLDDEIADGIALVEDAIRNHIDRLNAMCSARNDWRPVVEILRWADIAELMGLVTDENGLQTAVVLEDLCLQVEILEATLPDTIEAFEPATLDLRAGFSIGGRAPVFEPALNINTDGGFTASIAPGLGTTGPDGRFTAEVSLMDGSNRARVDVEAQFPEIPAINAARRLEAEGRVQLELAGKPADADDDALADHVEIGAGEDAVLILSLMKGRGGHPGRAVTLGLDGPGSLSATSTGVDSETGTTTIWYTAPEEGEGDAVVTATFFEGGSLFADTVSIHYAPADPVEFDLTGTWSLLVDGFCPGTLTVTQTGSTFQVSGSVGGGYCPFTASGSGNGQIAGNTVSFGIAFGSGSDGSGAGLGSINFEGTINASHTGISGTYSGDRSGSWQARR